jgi:hypothetical protein
MSDIIRMIEEFLEREDITINTEPLADIVKSIESYLDSCATEN